MHGRHSGRDGGDDARPLSTRCGHSTYGNISEHGKWRQCAACRYAIVFQVAVWSLAAGLGSRKFESLRAAAEYRGSFMPIAEKLPPSEAARLAAVRRYDILDSPPDGAFDRITALAARRFGVPIAIISIVDEDRIWFKSHHGVPVEQIDREPGLCASAILGDTPYLIEDARKDPRSLANPLVAGEFGLRFYAAVPLTTSDGHNLGTLCVIDKEPRPIDDEQIEDLKDLASIVMDQLELGLSARHAVGKANLMAKEIDHRVMNSLQFVSALLAMQSRSPDVGEAATHLAQAANRVAAVAQVHRHFYADSADRGILRRVPAAPVQRSRDYPGPGNRRGGG